MRLLTSVLDDSRHQLVIHHRRLEHLRHGLLFKYTLLLALDGETDVDRTALGRRDLRVEAVLREIDLTRVCRVELNHGCGACDLQSQGRRGSHGHGGDDGLDEHGGFGAVDWIKKIRTRGRW